MTSPGPRTEPVLPVVPGPVAPARFPNGRSGRLVGKLRAFQAFDGVLELQPFFLQPAQLKLVHVDPVLEPPDGGIQIPVFLLKVGDFSSQIDLFTLGGFVFAFLLL